MSDPIFKYDLAAKPDELRELIEVSHVLAEKKADSIAAQYRKKPEKLLERTQKEFNQLKLLVHRGIHKSYEIGLHLMALKKIIQHGGWEPMLDKLNMSRQSANVYMQLAKSWKLIEPQILKMNDDEISTRECLRYVKSVEEFLEQSDGAILIDEIPEQKPDGGIEPIKSIKKKRSEQSIPSICEKARAAVGKLLTFSGVSEVDATLAEIKNSIEMHQAQVGEDMQKNIADQKALDAFLKLPKVNDDGAEKMTVDELAARCILILDLYGDHEACDPPTAREVGRITRWLNKYSPNWQKKL